MWRSGMNRALWSPLGSPPGDLDYRWGEREFGARLARPQAGPSARETGADRRDREARCAEEARRQPRRPRHRRLGLGLVPVGAVLSGDVHSDGARRGGV
jgi:hypothetical protein